MRLMLRFSLSQATVASIIEMAEVRAAIESMAKNSTPNSCPKGIWLKATGRLMKISPGPEDGSMPLAKMIGKIASPAISATRVSAIATVKVVRAMEVPDGR